MSFPIHPDDVESPRFGGWADDFNTFTEACIYYGIETPAQIAAEDEYDKQMFYISTQDDLESKQSSIFGLFRARDSNYKYSSIFEGFDDEIPF